MWSQDLFIHIQYFVPYNIVGKGGIGNLSQGFSAIESGFHHWKECARQSAAEEPIGFCDWLKFLVMARFFKA